MTVHFEVVTFVSAPVETVFDVELDIDVHTSSMSKSGERAIAGVTSGLIGLGEEVTWRARHFGIPFTMTSRITEWDRPRRFVDEQVRGPFARWRHEHSFVQSGDETEMRDVVTFDAPLGPLGRLVEITVLGRYLERLIETRNAYVARIAESR